MKTTILGHAPCVSAQDVIFYAEYQEVGHKYVKRAEDGAGSRRCIISKIPAEQVHGYLRL
jgi:hypothetical protein